MIIKEKETARPTDPMLKAGYEAEKQMAFFLRRAFADSPDVFVFNDVMFERNGERAQIDHLVVHRFGFAIVESKSITGSVRVNEHLEFTRVWRDRRSGMRSPIEQARLQAQLLQSLLNDSKETLRPKKLMGTVQPSFGEERFQVLVAISDQGIIERNGANPPELMKAERVAAEIKEKTDNFQQTQGIKGFATFMTADKKEAKRLETHHLSPFTDKELEAVKAFLETNMKRSKAPERQEVSKASKQVTAVKETSPSYESDTPTVEMKCGDCGATNVEIPNGRFGYYLRCLDCGKTNNISKKCEVCGSEAKLRKRGRCFYRDCGPCGTLGLVHTNPE
ncbi:MAG: nuclease-related domain-containing protein [Rhodopirellula sp. JB055]|uniref:nuclease-related domain-containing protein n=1 Tax=Rhodopirellula sp. JB055 TaxID=3342846 RepID=UPI003709E2E7